MPIHGHWPDWPQRWMEFQQEMRRLFDESLGGFLDRRSASRRFPPVNLYETEGALVLLVEIPGVVIEQLDLSVTEDSLTLEGERRLECPEGATYVAQERQHGRFRRVVPLPQSVDAEKVKAEYTDGILTVTLPKAPAAEPRTVHVKTQERPRSEEPV